MRSRWQKRRKLLASFIQSHIRSVGISRSFSVSFHIAPSIQQSTSRTCGSFSSAARHLWLNSHRLVTEENLQPIAFQTTHAPQLSRFCRSPVASQSRALQNVCDVAYAPLFQRSKGGCAFSIANFYPKSLVPVIDFTFRLLHTDHEYPVRSQLPESILSGGLTGLGDIILPLRFPQTIPSGRILCRYCYICM